MRRELVCSALALLLGAALGFWFAEETAERPTYKAVISPGAEDELMALLESANRSISIEMFMMNHKGLMGALVDAKRRGVDVRVILEPRVDGGQNIEAMNFLRERGVNARWASLKFARTHSKLVIVDGVLVLVGSPNWSYSAMGKNRETSVLVESRKLAEEFGRMFEEDWRAAG